MWPEWANEGVSLGFSMTQTSQEVSQSVLRISVHLDSLHKVSTLLHHPLTTKKTHQNRARIKQFD